MQVRRGLGGGWFCGWFCSPHAYATGFCTPSPQRCCWTAPNCRAPVLAAGGQAAGATAAAQLAEDCALVLWCAAGTDFQVRLMTGKDAASDDLLQAVMQRLEEQAAEAGEVANADAAGAAAAAAAAAAEGAAQLLAT